MSLKKGEKKGGGGSRQTWIELINLVFNEAQFLRNEVLLYENKNYTWHRSGNLNKASFLLQINVKKEAISDEVRH